MKIENFNNFKKCNENFCDEDYSYSFPIMIGDMEIHIVLCEEHYNKLQETIRKQLEGIYGC